MARLHTTHHKLEACLTIPLVGRRGSIEWALRSPDLRVLDFYLWDYLEQTVYSKPINNLNHLRQRITEEIQLIEPEMFSFEY